MSAKTATANKNLQSIKAMIDDATPGFSTNPGRFYQMAISIFAAENGISFKAFSTPSWNIFAAMIPCPDRERMLKNIDVPRFIIEQYCAIKAGIIEEFSEAREFYAIPFMSLTFPVSR